MKKLMTLLTGGLLLAAVQLSAQTAAAKPVTFTFIDRFLKHSISLLFSHFVCGGRGGLSNGFGRE